MTLRDLIKPLQQHPFFRSIEMSPGEMLAELKRCAAKTQATIEELLYAIQLMNRNPKRYPDPFYALKEDWQFISGQCLLQDDARKQRAEVANTHDTEAIHQALQWYNRLPGQEQHSLFLRIQARLQQLFANQANRAYLWQNPLSGLLGKHILVAWHRYYTDAAYRARCQNGTNTIAE